MSKDDAIIIIANLEDVSMFFNPCDVQEAKTMAIKALEQIDKIKQIIAIDNSVIQEDVMKYKMICEVVEK